MSNNNVEYWSFREPEGTANIASRLVGSGDKLVAAFPGLGISGNMFDRLAEHFDGDVRFLLPDPPGHGYSGPLPSGNYHADYMAKMFHQYLSEKRNDDKISIVGFSIGGLFAMKYAAKFPEDIRSLILVSVGYDNPYLQDPKYTENVVRRYIRMWGSSDKKRDRTIDFSKLEGIEEDEIKSIIAQAADKTVLDLMLRDNWRHNALENPDTGRGDLEVIAKAGIPVLFVYGAEDCLVPSTVIEKATSVFKEEQCRIVAVPGYHSFPISAPETLIQVVDDNSGFLGLSKAEVTESVEPG